MPWRTGASGGCCGSWGCVLPPASRNPSGASRPPSPRSSSGVRPPPSPTVPPQGPPRICQSHPGVPRNRLQVRGGAGGCGTPRCGAGSEPLSLCPSAEPLPAGLGSDSESEEPVPVPVPVPVPSPVPPRTKRRRELASEDEDGGSSGGFSPSALSWGLSGHCWAGVIQSLSPLPHPWGAQPSPLSLHPQAPSRPPQLPAPRRMRRRRKRIHSPGGGGSASAAWKRKRRRTERLPISCLCPGLVLFPGLFADFIGLLQLFCSFSWVSTDFLGFLQISFCRF
ncbi:basic proline-rich protein-like isoform X1 [Serinus canaria]|uniref:basic proline-rich protein-like isoform X1 n=1 Tax=Serinus canaria TaxID=9135 RepID=UPI0021CCAB7B|nr:basic proline-rich protein-like isoform X1 [Serinus canaria]